VVKIAGAPGTSKDRSLMYWMFTTSGGACWAPLATLSEVTLPYDPTKDAGFFARELAVYERADRPCPRCGATIKRAVDSGRSTYWCSGCQR
jgi:hypothetical protein